MAVEAMQMRIVVHMLRLEMAKLVIMRWSITSQAAAKY